MQDDICGAVDHPSPGSKVVRTPINIKGWALCVDDPDPIVEMLLDGKHTANIETGMARLDIEKRFPDRPSAWESGFLYSLYAGKFEEGTHELQIKVRSRSGVREFDPIQFEWRKEYAALFDVVARRPRWKLTGRRFVEMLKSECGLTPDHKVLDIGCAAGRIAMPLTRFLSEKGGYEGFDIAPTAIEWNQQNVTPKYSNFGFTLIDLYSHHYNPSGTEFTESLRFPYDDNSFDVIFLSSIFTHLLPKAIENYCREIARVGKPGGNVWVSIKLLNKNSLKRINDGTSREQFPYYEDSYRYARKDNPEASIAHDEDWVLSLFQDCGLLIEKPILYGGWSGGQPDTRQDRIIARIQ